MREGWIYQKLGETCKVERGSSPRPIQKFITEREDGVNWIKIGDVGEYDKYVIKTKQKITKEGAEKSRFVDVGDFILSNSMSFGRPYIMKISGYIHDGWFVLRLPDYLNPDYFWYLLSSPLLSDQFNLLAAGAIVKNISSDLVKKAEIPIPPLQEQQQIVAILDEAFAAIDQAKANIQKNIENAKELFQSKLNEIFSQKGKGWEEKRFKDVCVLQRGFDLPTRLRKKGKYDLVTSSGIKDTHNVYKVEGPGVVTGRSGSIGNVFYVEDNFWPLNTALYIKDFKGNSVKYVYYFLKSFDLSKYSTGAGVPTLNRNFVHDEIVLSTNNQEQQDIIVKTLNLLTKQSDFLTIKYQEKLSFLEEVKKSILQKAFAGELTNRTVEV